MVSKAPEAAEAVWLTSVATAADTLAADSALTGSRGLRGVAGGAALTLLATAAAEGVGAGADCGAAAGRSSPANTFLLGGMISSASWAETVRLNKKHKGIQYLFIATPPYIVSASRHLS